MMTDVEVSELVRLCCSSQVADMAEALRRLEMLSVSIQYGETVADPDRLENLIVAAQTIGGSAGATIVERITAAVSKRYMPEAAFVAEWAMIAERLADGR